MKLTIVAATGGIGRHLLDQGLAAGHDVTAVARRPDDLPAAARRVACDLTDPNPTTLQAAVAGADAVLSGLGPRSKADAGIATRGTVAVVDAMHVTGTERLLVVSAAPVGTVASPGHPDPPRHDPGDGLVMRTVLSPMIKRILRDHYRDLAEMEDVLRASGLAWTSVRPPRLTDKAWTGTSRQAIDQNVRGGTTISRADVATAMLALIDRADTIGHAVAVAS
jgi:putative NADH-flavin reductase